MTPSATRDPSGAVRLEFPFNRGMIESLKREIPARGRSYDPVTHVWLIDHAWANSAVNILLRFMPDARLIRNGERARTRTVPSPVATDEYRTLFVAPDAPPEVVEAAYKALARMNHPDVGGDTATMRQINAAYERLRSRRQV